MKRSTVRNILIEVAILVAGLLWWERHVPLPGVAHYGCSGCNLILVTIDTLRADRLGVYGNSGKLTPNLDSLAEHGVLFTHAYTHVPLTLPAHTSILTGLIPAHHWVRNNVTFRLGDREQTLATRLKAAGYRTGAFVGAFVLDRRFGLSQGFDEYDDRLPEARDSASFGFARRKAPDVLGPAGDWIAQTKWPYFAWIHLFDPHAPYEAPAQFRTGRASYDAAVAYTDAMLGAFFDKLRSAGKLTQTLIVVTGDHGESLGEHGETTHGLFAYDATLAVPLIIAGPPVVPHTISTPVAHTDIVPTAMELLGLPVPAGLDGVSLMKGAPGGRALYFEAMDANLTRGWAPLTGVVRDGWKYIDLPIQELYDLSSDPHELSNQFAKNRQAADEMSRALQLIPSNGRGPSSPLNLDASDRLRALGYVGGAVAHTGPSHYSERDDPKKLVALNERFNVGLEAFNEGRGNDALAAFTAVLDERPDFITARTSAATILLAGNRPSDAVKLLRNAPADQAAAPELLAKMGSALRDTGDLSGAADAFTRALQAGDQNPALLNDLGVVFARMGREDEARRMFNQLLKLDPRSAGTWYNLGMFELVDRHPERAADALRHAVDVDPEYGDAWRELGMALLQSDRPAAIGAWKRAERLKPADYDLLFNLGMVLADNHREAEAVPYLERFEREAPPGKYAADLPRVRDLLARLRH